MKKHKETHTRDFRYTCEGVNDAGTWGCGKGFHKKGDLDRHLNRSKAYECRDKAPPAEPRHGLAEHEADESNASTGTSDSTSGTFTSPSVTSDTSVSFGDAIPPSHESSQQQPAVKQARPPSAPPHSSDPVSQTLYMLYEAAQSTFEEPPADVDRYTSVHAHDVVPNAQVILNLVGPSGVAPATSKNHPDIWQCYKCHETFDQHRKLTVHLRTH